MKFIPHAVLTALLLSAAVDHSNAQAPLSALGTTTTIDFSTTVTGVNNGLFDAQAPTGDVSPATGQLDYDAWDFLDDASATNAANSAATFPGTMPDGGGIAVGGSLNSGINAVDINGTRAFGVQPTGSHWTSGNLTLRAQNSTGGAVSQLDMSYSVFIFNDADRANSVRLYYSLTAEANSWVEIPSAAVTSPAALDAAPAWVESPVTCTVGGISIDAGDYIYLRWVGDDVSGSGTRDEFAFSNIGLTPEAVTGPMVTASTTALNAFDQIIGTPSTAQNLTVSGSNLTGDVTVTAPAPFEVSTSEASGYASSVILPQTGGALAATTVYVRMNSASGGAFSDQLSITSPGALEATVGLSGTAISNSLPAVFINELMASNASTIMDENGEYDDWFEIYNSTSDAVDLAGWYTSDDANNLTKYQFPIGGTEAIVPANGFLLVWADNQTEQGDLHTDFALSANGEAVILTAPDGVSVADSISFGAQDDDISYGRQADGELPWVLFSAPTPGASNQGTTGITVINAPSFHAWPNPVVGDVLHFDRPVTGDVLGIDGRIQARLTHTREFSTAALASGTYVLRTKYGAAVRFLIP